MSDLHSPTFTLTVRSPIKGSAYSVKFPAVNAESAVIYASN